MKRLSEDERFFAFLIGRLTNWGNGFEKFMTRHAPGFKQPHEARIYRDFWAKIDNEIDKIAAKLGDRHGLVKVFVHTGGCVQPVGHPIINTPIRLVRYLIDHCKEQAR